jgi:hypothetical protein
MAPKKIHIRRSSETGQFTVGAKSSASISKVEGLRLSGDMQATFSDFEKKGMSAAARRAVLTDKYGKKGR